MMISYKNTIVQDDMNRLLNDKAIAWDRLKRKTVLITGANSMLATYMVYALVALNEQKNSQTKIVATARNIEKAKLRFADVLGHDYFELLEHDVTKPFAYEEEVDYIVHAASNASPHFILNDPVGIIEANTIGTLHLLNFAREKKVTNFLFLSTREIYGKPIAEKINEEAYGAFDILESRACYPESKRMAETLLRSYYDQYGVPFTVARIAHSYGPGMETANDGRIMSDLINNVLKNEDIILKSAGTAERAFCYLSDAVAGLFLIMLNGEIAQAYNVANEDRTIMIRELAQLLVQLLPEKAMKVVFNIPQEMSAGYSKMGDSRLDTGKIEKLGWTKQVPLEVGLIKTVRSFEE
ncbi:NAD-dependent epimerase/dehydratase family protein [Streptococcus porci]|uniref:NAD-dependent epimerase/dehydratase family protein n=1 Tax=Streptococcus porci TaxID=502567 RepID=UPI0003F66D28|nr:NAD-dependent epimerase/dehydratase family protein [Streptococcus porci]